VLIAAIFSGIEAGILSVNRIRLRHQVRLKEKAAIKLNRLLSRPERLLVTVLLVINFMNVCAVALSTRALVRWLGTSGYFVAFVLWLPVYLGIEVLPKSLFRRFPYRALAIFSGMLRIADLLFSPLLAAGSALYNVFFSSREGSFKKGLIAREDFKFLIHGSERTGVLTAVERRMIDNVIDFRTVTARHVMQPIQILRSIKAGAPVEELLAISHSTQIDRLPVMSESGEITGLVNVFEVLLDSKSGAESVEKFAHRIVTVAPEEPAYAVIRKLRAARGEMAAVIDAKEGAVGFVTSEDLFKRLIGPAA
jgi:CBS domain containing-hemolysin-like protein